MGQDRENIVKCRVSGGVKRRSPALRDYAGHVVFFIKEFFYH